MGQPSVSRSLSTWRQSFLGCLPLKDLSNRLVSGLHVRLPHVDRMQPGCHSLLCQPLRELAKSLLHRREILLHHQPAVGSAAAPLVVLEGKYQVFELSWPEQPDQASVGRGQPALVHHRPHRPSPPPVAPVEQIGQAGEDESGDHRPPGDGQVVRWGGQQVVGHVAQEANDQQAQRKGSQQFWRGAGATQEDVQEFSSSFHRFSSVVPCPAGTGGLSVRPLQSGAGLSREQGAGGGWWESSHSVRGVRPAAPRR